MSYKMIDDPNALDQYLQLLGDDGPAFVVDIVDTLLETAPGNFDQLEKSLANEDFKTFRRAAHTLKTGCKTVGATGLAEIFLELEEYGAAGDLSSAGRVLKTGKSEFRALSDELMQKKVALIE